MQFLVRHLERITVFIVLVIATGVFWPPGSYFAGAHAQLWANDPFNTAFYAVLIAFLAAGCFLRLGTVLPLVRASWPIWPMLALAYLSAYWSQFPDLVLLHTTKIAAMALLGIYLLARGDIGDMVSLFVKVGLVAGAASVAAVILLPELAFSSNVGYTSAWRGAFTDKNELGMVAALGILFAVYAFRYRYGSRLLSGIAIPLNVLLLYFSESRTPLVLLLGGLYVGLVARAFRRRDAMGLVTGFALTVFGLVGLGIAATSFGEVLAMLGRDPTLSERTRLWETIAPFIAQRPWLGYGLDSFWLPESPQANVIWALLNWQAPSAHNFWLEMALDLGIVGCFLAALTWLVVFWRALRLVFVPGALHVVFGLVLLAMLFGENLTEYAFFRAELSWSFFVAILVHFGRELAVRRAVQPLRPTIDRGPLQPLVLSPQR